MKTMKDCRKLLWLPFLLVAIVLACQDEIVERWNGKGKEWKATIERAKVIFSDRSPDFPVVQTRSLSDIVKSIVFEPLWDEAFIARHDDGSTTVETHIRLSKPLIIIPNESYEAYFDTKDVRYLQYLSRAVVLMKEESTPQAFLMTIIGSKRYMESHDFQLWGVSYRNIPEDFSGMILYHTLSGVFVNGWYVEEGWNFNTCNPISAEDAILLSRSGSNCYTVESSYVAVDCVTNNGYNTYEGSDELFFWTNTQCGEPYRVIETYQVCDDEAEDDSGSGGGGISTGGSSTVGGETAPKAKAIFRNSSMTDENWGIVERMLEKIVNDCMGKSLYDSIKTALNGGRLIIQFKDVENGEFGYIGEGAGITLTMKMESNQLFHEMMHAYRAYQETTASYNASTLNGEIEAWYAQYLYVRKLPEYKGSEWERRYEKKTVSRFIKLLEGYVNHKGKIQPDMTEFELETFILNQLIPAYRSIGYNYPYDDYNRTVMDNFKNLRKLTENCL